jgi:hypothetical protein
MGRGSCYNFAPWCVLKDVLFLQVKVLSGEALERPGADSSREEKSD